MDAIEPRCPTLRHRRASPISDPGEPAPTPTGPWRRCSPSPPRSPFEPVPFDHPLYVLYSSGTTGLPKADRPRARRHHRSSTSRPSRSTTDLGPADRFCWFTHHRLDDVELPRVGPAASARPSCCSTATRRDPDLGTLWDLAADTGVDRLRRERAVPHGVPQGRPRAGRASTWALRCVGSTGRAAAARTGSAGCATPSARHRRRLDQRRHRRVRRRSSVPSPLRAGAGGRDQLPAARLPRSRRSTRRVGRARPACRASSSSPSRCRRCRSGFWGDADGSALRARLLRATTPACGATATGSRSPTTARA